MNLVIIAAVVLTLLWFFLLKGKKTAGERMLKEHPAVSEHGKYHCVSVHFGPGACQAVMKLEGKRLLSAEASTLPLINCDAEKCECRFHHHEERRVEDRRGAYNKALNDITESTMTMTPRSATDRRKIR